MKIHTIHVILRGKYYTGVFNDFFEALDYMNNLCVIHSANLAWGDAESGKFTSINDNTTVVGHWVSNESEKITSLDELKGHPYWGKDK